MSGGVPEIAGANFATFDELSANSNGSAIVAATLEPGSGGVTSQSDTGIWLFPSNGSAQLIAREGDQLAGHTIAALSLLSDEYFGRSARGFNVQNQLLFQADFTNGDAGLFLFSPSDSTDADFNLDTFVDATDLGTWKAAYGIDAGADADSDGDSDGADFLAWQRQYTGAGTLAASLPVPEPSATWITLFASILFVPRRLTG